MDHRAEFDQFADRYGATMERSCALSGESPLFFAVERRRWCAKRLPPGASVETVLDFGCGTGGSIRYFFEVLHCRKVIGVDPSVESLDVARRNNSMYPVTLVVPEDFTPSGDIRFAFCNGVFHHIEPQQRTHALSYIHACLEPGGLFAFWENNPWNPVVVYGMSLNEFDRNAQTVSALVAVRLLKKAGFRIRRVHFCFFFPRFLRGLRRLEPALRWLPFGGQYLILAQK